MANIFDQFDAVIDRSKIEGYKKEASENEKSFDPVPSGKYITRIESMALGKTKDGRPMFRVCMRIVEGCGDSEKAYISRFKKNKPCIFHNRVMAGTKDDNKMISLVENWLYKLDLSKTIVCDSFKSFGEQLAAGEEECKGLEFMVDYDDSRFTNIIVEDVFEA